MIFIKNVTVVSAQGREVRDVSFEGADEVVDGTGKFCCLGRSMRTCIFVTRVLQRRKIGRLVAQLLWQVG